MRQIDSHLVRFKNVVIAHQNDDGNVPNVDCFDLIAGEEKTKATVPIPKEALVVLGKGRIVTVTSQEMDTLEIGKKIADVTRRFFPNGSPNQVFDLARTKGVNRLMVHYARHEMPRQHVLDVRAEGAINAGITGAARCGDGAEFAFMLTKILGVNARLVADPLREHEVLLLEPDSPRPIVVDPWSLIVTVCLLPETDLQPTEIMAEYTPGNAVSERFNLSSIEKIGNRFRQRFGPNGLEDALTEYRRQKLGLYSNLLDGYCLAQGLMRYDRIDTSELEPSDVAKVAAEQARMKKMVQKDQLLEAAKETRSKAQVISAGEPRITVSKKITAAETTVIDDSKDTMKGRLKRAAGKAAMEKALRITNKAAAKQARENGNIRTNQTITMEATGTATMKEGAVSGIGTARAIAYVEPGIWHKYLAVSSLNTYQSGARKLRFNKITPEQATQIEAARNAASTRRFPESFIKRASENTASTSPPPRTISEQALLVATIVKVGALFDELQASHTPRDPGADAPVIVRQQALLRQLDDRLEHLPADELYTILRAIANLLPNLYHGARTGAAELLRIWVESVTVVEDRLDINSKIPGTDSEPTSDDNTGSPPTNQGESEPDNISAAGSNTSTTQPTTHGTGMYDGMDVATIDDTLQNRIDGIEDLDAAGVQTLQAELEEGLRELRRQSEELWEARTDDILEAWIAGLNVESLVAQLTPIVDATFEPQDLVMQLCETLRGQFDDDLRDAAIDKIEDYLPNINAENLGEAAIPIARCVNNIRDSHEQVRLMGALQPYLADLNDETKQQVFTTLRSSANRMMEDYEDDALIRKFDEMFAGSDSGESETRSVLSMND